MALRAVRKKFTGNGPKLNAPLMDVDNYPARLVQIVDLGTHANFFDKEKVNHEVSLTYELVTEFMEDDDGNAVEDKPRWFSEKINFIDLPEDASYEEILADQYRGKAKMVLRSKVFDPKGKYDFDFSQFLGGPCVVEVIQKRKSKKDATIINAIGGVVAPMRGLQIAEAINTPRVFMLDEPDLEVFNGLPEWQREYIKENLDYQGSKLEALIEGKEYKEPQSHPDFDDDVPPFDGGTTTDEPQEGEGW